MKIHWFSILSGVYGEHPYLSAGNRKLALWSSSSAVSKYIIGENMLLYALEIIKMFDTIYARSSSNQKAWEGHAAAFATWAP